MPRKRNQATVEEVEMEVTEFPVADEDVEEVVIFGDEHDEDDTMIDDETATEMVAEGHVPVAVDAVVEQATDAAVAVIENSTPKATGWTAEKKAALAIKMKEVWATKIHPNVGKKWTPEQKAAHAALMKQRFAEKKARQAEAVAA